MKTKQINTGVCDILLVELPEGARDLYITSDNWIEYKTSTGVLRHDQLYGNYKRPIRADQVTEEQARLIVDSGGFVLLTDPPKPTYKSYLKSGRGYFVLALESLDSLYEANEVCFENPLGSMPMIPINDRMFNYLSYEKYRVKLRDWKEAQENVWDKTRTYLLIKQK